MGYDTLYQYCQTLTPKIKRNTLRDKVLELCGFDRIRTAMTTLDISVCRGFYLSAKNTENQFVKQNGCNVIVLPKRGQLNHCWERFIYVKELMHSFDNPDEATDSGDDFEKMLAEFLQNEPDRSPQSKSEVFAFWMALGVLCPEDHRIRFQEMRNSKQIDDYGIALQVRIPAQYVPYYFDDDYLPIIEMLREIHP